MTEFDLGWPDDVERADWFEDAIRAFFAHPKLGGVILWGFWNQSMKYQDHELVSGPDQSHLTVRSGGFFFCVCVCCCCFFFFGGGGSRSQGYLCSVQFSSR